MTPEKQQAIDLFKSASSLLVDICAELKVNDKDFKRLMSQLEKDCLLARKQSRKKKITDEYFYNKTSVDI